MICDKCDLCGENATIDTLYYQKNCF